MNNVFRKRPFKIRNADEYDVSNILSLFVSPINGLASPFDYENSIIKGRMGSGKTMYLRANHAYYLSSLVPSLIDDCDEVILPVFIRLSDFQHISDPQSIYRAIIIKIIEELTSIYLHLQDMKNLAQIQGGMKNLPEDLWAQHKLSNTFKQLAKLGSDEYIERVSSEFGSKAVLKPKFFELSANWKEGNLLELKRKSNPGIRDVEDCYKNLLEGQEGKILLLIDEAGSLDKSFFKNENEQCFFEILMNQFRTASFIRTKIAVYPNSYSDILTETRYGDSVLLEDDVCNTQGYKRFRNRTLEMIKNYLNPNSYEETLFKVNDLFDLSNTETSGDAIEQIIYASNGNMRRMMQLLDLTLETAYLENNCACLITKEHAINALKTHANKFETEFNEQESELLTSLGNVCKSRGTYRFQFPNVPLYKFTNRSQEHNVINVISLGSGRRATTYSFDYSYAVANEIPTHRMLDSQHINKDRTINTGIWLVRSATISEELIEHANLPGKIYGEIEFLSKAGDSGFIRCGNNNEFYFPINQIIETDRGKTAYLGRRVRFYPFKHGEGDTHCAVLVELL